MDLDRGERPPLDDAERFYAAICKGGALCAYAPVGSPGAGASDALVEALVDRHADLHLRRADVRDRLVRRLGETPTASAPAARISVVVCTHRRPDMLKGCLAALAALEPPPHEVIVIDNRPGHASARQVAEQFGARYAVEEHGGQNAARRLGLALATGDAIAFTDDDCRPPEHWLRRPGELLEDPSVAAVCGPVIAASVALPEQEERQRLLPFPALHSERRFDFGVIAPVVAGGVGCGANLIVRRDALEQAALPDDLEGGTPARSGGDLYLLYRLVRSGHAIVHAPESWVAHEHAVGTGAAERTARAYGTGFAAFLSKVLVEERELSAPAAWTWLLRRLSSALLEHAVASDPRAIAVNRSYVGGGLAGPIAWRRARRAAAGRTGPVLARRRAGTVGGSGRPPHAGGVEVIAADDASARNAAARASAADILLFVASGAETPDELLAAHAAAHAGSPVDRIVIGVEHVHAPEGSGLAACRAAARSTRRSHLAATAIATTVESVPHSNLSIRRSAFLALGGYDERFSGRRAARELAWRALGAGLRLDVEPAARAHRITALTTAALIADARAAGVEQALMSREHPELATGIELRGAREILEAPTGARKLAILAENRLASERLAPVAVALAGAFEAVRQRRMWLHTVKLAERAAFAGGWRDAGGGAPAAPLAVDLNADEPVPVPCVTPRLELRAGGRTLGTITPAFGIWHPGIADQALALLEPDALAALAREPAIEVVPGPDALADCAVALTDADAAPAFRALGAEVHVVPAGGGWRAAADALAGSSRDLLAIPLAGVTVQPRWLVDARAAAAGAADVAVVFGAGIAPGAPRPPAFCERERPGRLRYRFRGSPPQYVLVARRRLEALGGLDREAGRLGGQAPALALAERALAAGLAVVSLDVHGITPAPSSPAGRARLARRRTRDIAALQARDARRGGALAALPARLLLPWLAGPLPRPFRIAHSPHTSQWLRDGADTARGAARGLLAESPHAAAFARRPG